MLNERKLEVIKLIYNKQLDIEQIAEILKVSSRTVRRDLINIIEIVSEMGYTIEKKKTMYKLIDNDNNLFEQLNTKVSNNLVSEEKLLVALKTINKGDDTINIEKVANDLYVSASFVKSFICQFLEEYNVNYLAKGASITLNIDNIQRREIIVAILRDYMRTVDINNIVLEETIQSSKVRNYHIVKDYIDVNFFDQLFIMIEDIFNESNKYITDFQLIMITLTVCVSARQSDNNRLQVNNVSIISNKIIEQIIDKSKIENENEQKYLSMKLDSIITELEYEKVNLAFISKISEAISEVEQKLGIEFVNKRKLEYQICTHNARATTTDADVYLKNNVSFLEFIEENKCLYEILNSVDKLLTNGAKNVQYILIYFVMALEETLAFREWQICIICFGGMGTSLMIKKQLEKEYPNALIQNLSYARALANGTDEADVVISNYKLPNNIQDLVVGHVITKQDIKAINQILVNKNRSLAAVSMQEKIVYNIGFRCDSSDCDSVTYTLLNDYEQQQILTDSEYVFQKLKKRQLVGVGIPNSTIAFFHTRSSSINELVIATYNVKQFTTKGFDGNQIACNKILLVLVPVDISDDLLDKVNILSYSLISDDSLLTAIINDDKNKIQTLIS